MQLDQLVGTALTGTLRFSEGAVNDLLAREGTPVRGATITVAPHNQLVIRYGRFHATVAVEEQLDLASSPRLRLHVASFAVALALGTFVRQPYVHVRGREVTVDLAAVPALQPLSPLWRHLQRATIHTEPAALLIGFDVSVKE